MTDITLCTNNNCPSHRHCYRYAIPVAGTNAAWQSYALFSPEPGQQYCNHYINTEQRLRKEYHP